MIANKIIKIQMKGVKRQPIVIMKLLMTKIKISLYVDPLRLQENTVL